MNRLKELRIKKHLTQKECSKNLNLENITYNRYELGKRQPDIDTLKKIADYYGVSLDYLCEHDCNNLLDISGYNEYKKGVIFALNQLNEKNDLILLGYVTHVLAEQLKEEKK